MLTDSKPPRRYSRVTKTLRPEQAGTKKLVRRYGEALLCVRYREDDGGRRRCTTVELVIDERPIPAGQRTRRLVEALIPWDAIALRERAKALGATWNARNRTWIVPLRVARQLRLHHRPYDPTRKTTNSGHSL